MSAEETHASVADEPLLTVSRATGHRAYSTSGMRMDTCSLAAGWCQQLAVSCSVADGFQFVQADMYFGSVGSRQRAKV